MSNVVQIDVFNKRAEVNPFPQESDLYFPVYEYPLFIHSARAKVGNTDAFPVYSHKALVRSGQREPVILNVVGSGYKLIQNKELFHSVEDRFMQELSAKQLDGVKSSDRLSYFGRECFRDYFFPAVTFESPDGREIAFRLMVANSYGGTSFRLIVGAIEWYCSNGMIVGEYDIFYHRHTSGLTLDKIDVRIRSALDLFFKSEDMLQRWYKRTITDAEALEFLTEHSGFSKRKAESLFRQWLLESAQRGKNVWALYSALTYYSSHNAGEFIMRDTKSDHQAATMVKREREVRDIIVTSAWQQLAA